MAPILKRSYAISHFPLVSASNTINRQISYNVIKIKESIASRDEHGSLKACRGVEISFRTNEISITASLLRSRRFAAFPVLLTSPCVFSPLPRCMHL